MWQKYEKSMESKYHFLVATSFIEFVSVKVKIQEQKRSSGSWTFSSAVLFADDHRPMRKIPMREIRNEIAWRYRVLESDSQVDYIRGSADRRRGHAFDQSRRGGKKKEETRDTRRVLKRRLFEGILAIENNGKEAKYGTIISGLLWNREGTTDGQNAVSLFSVSRRRVAPRRAAPVCVSLSHRLTTRADAWLLRFLSACCQSNSEISLLLSRVRSFLSKELESIRCW